MAWSYSGDPSTSDKDRMRFALGDTDTNDQLLQDEEIQFALSISSKFVQAQLLCTESLASRYAHEASIRVGPMSQELGERAKLWEAKAEKLRKQVAGTGAPKAAAESIERDPLFRLGMHDIS